MLFYAMVFGLFQGRSGGRVEVNSVAQNYFILEVILAKSKTSQRRI